jgi:site-specific recombinase XerD
MAEVLRKSKHGLRRVVPTLGAINNDDPQKGWFPAMATIYKRTRDKGKRHVSYWIQYYDHLGQRRTKKGFTDKTLTEQLAAKLENEVMLRKRGMIDPEQEALMGEKSSPIKEHLDAFEKALNRKGNTPKHVGLTIGRVKKVIAGCKVKALTELRAEKVEEYLGDLRKKEGFGPRTHNHYVQAIDSFCRWLVSKKKLAGNPLISLPRLNAETDIRHKRRALSPEELSKLVASARDSKEQIQGFTGEARARLYLFGYLTGLRRKELASLTPRSFNLSRTPPTVTIEAACSKHRKTDVLPLHGELVKLLPAWLALVGPDELLFPRLAKRKTWLMVKKDLERIGIAYETPEGIADFHAAGRHSYVSGLLENGVSLTEARELARHGDIRMTMRYTHVGMESRAKALESLPWLHIGCTRRDSEGQTEASGDNEEVSEVAEKEDASPELVLYLP